MTRTAAVSVLVSVLLVATLGTPAGAGTHLSFIVDESGVHRAEPAEESSLEFCQGPLSPVIFSLGFFNPEEPPLNFLLLATLDPGLQIVPNSCDVTAGTCAVMSGPPQVTWMFTLQPGEFEDMQFRATIGFVPINTTVCVTYQLSVNGRPPFVLDQSCATTNSATPCAITAPALGRWQLLTAVVLLVLTAALALRRRRT